MLTSIPALVGLVVALVATVRARAPRIQGAWVLLLAAGVTALVVAGAVLPVPPMVSTAIIVFGYATGAPALVSWGASKLPAGAPMPAALDATVPSAPAPAPPNAGFVRVGALLGLAMIAVVVGLGLFVAGLAAGCSPAAQREELAALAGFDTVCKDGQKITPALEHAITAQRDAGAPSHPDGGR